MSIKVEVRKESGEVVGPASIQYHRIVSWIQRDQFPMLGYTNAIGDLVLNSLQVGDLIVELESILHLCHTLGPTAALAKLGAAHNPDSLTIPNWEPDRDLVPMIEGLKLMCAAVQAGEHRYLWFVGD